MNHSVQSIADQSRYSDHQSIKNGGDSPIIGINVKAPLNFQRPETMMYDSRFINQYEVDVTQDTRGSKFKGKKEKLFDQLFSSIDKVNNMSIYDSRLSNPRESKDINRLLLQS